jgi:hypothetical protein
VRICSRQIQERLNQKAAELLYGFGVSAAAPCNYLRIASEGIMSRRNGDKARFGRDRQRKDLQRKKSRALRKLLMPKPPEAVGVASK